MDKLLCGSGGISAGAGPKKRRIFGLPEPDILSIHNSSFFKLFYNKLIIVKSQFLSWGGAKIGSKIQ